MICKAIVEEIIDQYKVRVRVPTFHRGEESIGATPLIDMPVTIMCVQPGIYSNIKVKDVVMVDFEDDNVDKPVIIGLLFSENSKKSLPDITANSLKVKVNSKFTKDTTIGEVTPDNIFTLKGVHTNIQKQFDDANKRIKKIEDDGCGEIEEVLSQINNRLQDLLNK